MSLDVYLIGARSTSVGSGIFIREDGATREITREEWDARMPGQEPVIMTRGADDPVFTRNITHNLGKMAAEAGIYEHLWRPDEVGITRASQLIAPLALGLCRLCNDRNGFKRLNPENGWGSYEGLLAFVAEYLHACVENPDAAVEVSR